MADNSIASSSVAAEKQWTGEQTLCNKNKVVK